MWGRVSVLSLLFPVAKSLLQGREGRVRTTSTTKIKMAFQFSWHFKCIYIVLHLSELCFLNSLCPRYSEAIINSILCIYSPFCGKQQIFGRKYLEVTSVCVAMKPVHTPALSHGSVSEALPFHHHWHCIDLQCLIDCEGFLAALSAPVHRTFNEYLPHLRLFCPYSILCVGVGELIALQTLCLGIELVPC